MYQVNIKISGANTPHGNLHIYYFYLTRGKLNWYKAGVLNVLHQFKNYSQQLQGPETSDWKMCSLEVCLLLVAVNVVAAEPIGQAFGVSGVSIIFN